MDGPNGSGNDEPNAGGEPVAALRPEDDIDPDVGDDDDDDDDDVDEDSASDDGSDEEDSDDDSDSFEERGFEDDDEEVDDVGFDAASIAEAADGDDDEPIDPQRAIMLRTLESAVHFLERAVNHNNDDDDDSNIDQVEADQGSLSFYVQCRWSFQASFLSEGGGAGRGDDGRTALLFRRFVALLGDGVQGRYREVVRMIVVGFDFDNGDSYPPQDQGRLVGEIVRSMSLLRELMFKDCSLPAASCLDRLAASPPPRLRSLELTNCLMDSGGVAGVASLVGRPDCRIKTLVVTPAFDGLDPDDCRVLCQSVSRNPSLRKLHLKVKTVLADTLRGALGPTSALRKLAVEGPFAEEGAASLARSLRTNTRLVRLIFIETDRSCYASIDAQLQQLVDTYNITLRGVQWEGNDGKRIAGNSFSDSFRRNRWIRKVVRRLLRPNDYRVAPPSRWPHVFGSVSSFPTLLYRLLRRGNVDALCDAVRGDAKAAKGRRLARKRGHPRSPSS